MKYLLEELVDLKIGRTPPRKEQWWFSNTSGVKWVSIKDMGDSGRFIDNTSEFLVKDSIDKFNIPIVKKGTVILSFKLTVGRVSITQDDMLTNEAIAQLPVKDEKILNPMFLYYYLKSYNFNQLGSTSSIAQAINSKYLKKMEIDIPEISMQNKIVDILSSIDSYIECNQKINNNLEQQAMAIFKSWFVDFEPFNRKVPNNWVKYKLSDFLPVITGKKNANVSSSIGIYPFFSCSQDITWTDEYSFEGNAILVAGNGDFNVKFYNGKFEAYQRTYVLIPDNPRFSAWLFYVAKYNLNKITASARGSVIKFITKGCLEDFSFYAPSNLDDFDIIDQFTVINNIIASNDQENALLSKLRDMLLPKLMSGELDVSDIDL